MKMFNIMNKFNKNLKIKRHIKDNLIMCKDCVYYKSNDIKNTIRCPMSVFNWETGEVFNPTTESDFCSRGVFKNERKN